MSFSDRDYELAAFRTRIFQQTAEESRQLREQVANDTAAWAREQAEEEHPQEWRRRYK